LAASTLDLAQVDRGALGLEHVGAGLFGVFEATESGVRFGGLFVDSAPRRFPRPRAAPRASRRLRQLPPIGCRYSARATAPDENSCSARCLFGLRELRVGFGLLDLSAGLRPPIAVPRRLPAWPDADITGAGRDQRLIRRLVTEALDCSARSCAAAWARRGFGLVAGDAQVGRVELHPDLIRTHGLVVVHVNHGHRAADPG